MTFFNFGFLLWFKKYKASKSASLKYEKPKIWKKFERQRRAYYVKTVRNCQRWPREKLSNNARSLKLINCNI